jgi:hypothetical protein
LISDTHGLLREEALRALAGSDLIIHAGDVGRPEILDALKSVAPVVAVKGNIDTGAWASTLPGTAVAEAGATRIYVLHDVHSFDGVLYINPGSAGPRRFQLPITLARLDLGQTPWKVEFMDLSRPSTARLR